MLSWRIFLFPTMCHLHINSTMLCSRSTLVSVTLWYSTQATDEIILLSFVMVKEVDSGLTFNFIGRCRSIIVSLNLNSVHVSTLVVDLYFLTHENKKIHNSHAPHVRIEWTKTSLHSILNTQIRSSKYLCSNLFFIRLWVMTPNSRTLRCCLRDSHYGHTLNICTHILACMCERSGYYVKSLSYHKQKPKQLAIHMWTGIF